jgi:hypothetical protein
MRVVVVVPSHLVPDDAARAGADKGMVTRQVSDNAADNSACDTAGIGRSRNHRGRDDDRNKRKFHISLHLYRAGTRGEGVLSRGP